MSHPIVYLAPGKEKTIERFHPWIFSGAIDGTIPDGDYLAVELRDHRRQFLAWAQHNPGSKIRLRVYSHNTQPDEAWFSRQIHQAFATRRPWLTSDTDTARLIFSEADHLPGLIVDLLGPVMVVQFLSTGIDRLRNLLVPLLAEAATTLPAHCRVQAIVEKSDGDGRRMEGLPPSEGLLHGSLPPSDQQCLRESNFIYHMDLGGQKTGFYADQRENRRAVARYAAGRRVLDVCCYSGGFALHAAAAGAASIHLLDSSAAALDLARRNLAANIPDCQPESDCDDAFEALRRYRAEGKQFDLIILDPPKLCPSRNNLDRAMSAYKDLNFQAINLLAPGGILASFSCSGSVGAQDLRLWIAYAAKDARRELRVLEQLHQAPCHPVPLGFPEAEYLKGFILQAD